MSLTSYNFTGCAGIQVCCTNEEPLLCLFVGLQYSPLARVRLWLLSSQLWYGYYATGYLDSVDVISHQAGKTVPPSTVPGRWQTTTSTSVCYLLLLILHISHLRSASQFCVVMSGFKINDPIATLVLTPSYATPTLHVIGRTDMIVPAERSRLLSELSINKRVEEHDGGR